MRVFGLTKMQLLHAFTMVGYNLEAIRSFLAKKAEGDHPREGQGEEEEANKGTWPLGWLRLPLSAEF